MSGKRTLFAITLAACLFVVTSCGSKVNQENYDKLKAGMTVEQLEAARTPRTKALVFVSPSNPTGAVYPRDEIEAIGRWAVEHGIWVITDEIYEHLTYGDNEFHSMPTLVPEIGRAHV